MSNKQAKNIMKTLPLLLLLLLASVITAQEKTPDLVTDRPDQTESSVVVPHKSLQIETGFVMENDNDFIDQKSYAYNTTLLRYGLLEKLELRLGLEYLGDKMDFNNSDSTYSISGLSPLYTGFKIMIAEEDGWKPEMAFLGGLVLPFTANQDFKPEYTAANMRFSFAHTLSEKLSLGYNLGVEWDGESAIPAYFYSLALGLGLTDNLGMFLESYGLVSDEGDQEHLFDAGFTYLIMPNLQLDISGGIGLNSETINNFISFGFSYRLPK